MIIYTYTNTHSESPPPTNNFNTYPTHAQLSALPREVAAWDPPDGLRPKEGCVVGEGCQLGEQVNIKSSVIGAGCKVRVRARGCVCIYFILKATIKWLINNKINIHRSGPA